MPPALARPHSWRHAIAGHRALSALTRTTCSRSDSSSESSRAFAPTSSTRTATRSPPATRSARNNESVPQAFRVATARKGPSAPTDRRSSSRIRGGVRSPFSLVEHLLDGVHDRIPAGRLRGGGLAGLAEVLRDAVILLPAPQRRVEIHRLPLGMAVLHEPRQVGGDGLGELTYQIAVAAAEIEGDEHRLHRYRGKRLRLPGIGAGGNLGPWIELGDALVRDGDQREVVRLAHPVAEELHRVARHVEHGVHLSVLERGERL